MPGFWSFLAGLFNRQPGETGAVLGTVPQGHVSMTQDDQRVLREAMRNSVTFVDEPPPIHVLTAAETPKQPVPGVYAPKLDRFPACLAVTLHWEGGYSDHKEDPGGKTNLGVTQKTL